MASKTPIFLTGPTGYIGGSVLARLLQHPDAETFEITVLARSPEKATKLEAFGVRAVVGTNADLDLLEALSERSHVVFSCADADNLSATEAILRGLKKRHDTIGDLPILIHTSGTGLLFEPAKGMYAAKTIWSDMDVERLKSIPPTAIHHSVDLAVVHADEQDYARTYIVLPSIIYGMATNALVKAGISNPFSMLIPELIRVAIDRKQGGTVGPGKAVWPNVHIDDTADLYMVLFDAITRTPDRVGHGWEGFYFGENGEHSLYDISKAICTALVELGIGGSTEPTTLTTEELVKYFGSEVNGNFVGSTVRCTADRARSIGWRPTKTTKDLLASVKPEVETLWKKAQREGSLKSAISQSLDAVLGK